MATFLRLQCGRQALLRTCLFILLHEQVKCCFCRHSKSHSYSYFGCRVFQIPLLNQKGGESNSQSWQICEICHCNVELKMLNTLFHVCETLWSSVEITRELLLFFLFLCKPQCTSCAYTMPKALSWFLNILRFSPVILFVIHRATSVCWWFLFVFFLSFMYLFPLFYNSDIVYICTFPIISHLFMSKYLGIITD